MIKDMVSMFSLQPLKSDVCFVLKQNSSIRTSHIARLDGPHTSPIVDSTALEVSLLSFHSKKCQQQELLEAYFYQGYTEYFASYSGDL